jgi:hypothetical protein
LNSITWKRRAYPIGLASSPSVCCAGDNPTARNRKCWRPAKFFSFDRRGAAIPSYTPLPVPAVAGARRHRFQRSVAEPPIRSPFSPLRRSRINVSTMRSRIAVASLTGMIPVYLVGLFMQRWLIGGLTAGGIR